MARPIGIYVRVSRKGDREDEKFHSPREQAERAKSLVKARGLTPGPVFEDIDVSGGKRPEDRPAMGELLKAIKAGRLGGIAAFSLDRLSRDPAHGDALVKAVTKAGGVLLTPDMPEAIDTPTGEFTFGMLLQVAKLYRSQSGARFASAKERAVLAGIPVHPTPVGYRKRADRRLELDPQTAPVVRELFERKAGGAGNSELADFLTEATGRAWTLPGVRCLIKNRIYATGRLTLNDLVSDWDAGVIVDEPLWHAAQGPGGVRPKRAKDSPWLLTGIARCASCGQSMGCWNGAARRRWRTKKGGELREATVTPEQREHGRRYRCQNRSCPSRASIRAGHLERYVALRTIALDHELATSATAVDLGDMETELATAEKRLAQVLAPESQDALGDAWASTAKARRLERDAVARRLGEAQARGDHVPRSYRVEEVWDDMRPDDRRALLASFWKEIRVGRKEGATQPVKFIARGPHVEVEVDLPTNGKEEA